MRAGYRTKPYPWSNIKTKNSVILLFFLLPDGFRKSPGKLGAQSSARRHTFSFPSSIPAERAPTSTRRVRETLTRHNGVEPERRTWATAGVRVRSYLLCILTARDFVIQIS